MYNIFSKNESFEHNSIKFELQYIYFRKVKMRISTSNHKRKTYNVIGIIRGAVEPGNYGYQIQ